ncbi:ATP-binding protein [Bradyrhizobium sp. Arg237L]|uniref:AlbA family DNA-binding domain-containing protein n=1 Tax=Bradyrhizobium sp. Arg237L TaxID=3003352 RepID=UPI00249F2E2D|nr:ATP-binding protein [Bradyrhizobium sp. Arg237L]MDI4236670.1 ATP-binding protein [Bradyrhizobium sp. Arg237L]
MTDDEIALAKAMLRRGMKNDVIHFFFNKPKRLISSGRITQIKQSKYGASVEEATQAALDEFLQNWEAQADSRSTPRTAVEQTHLRSMFHEQAGAWILSAGETDHTECKRAFRLNPEVRFADVIRSIAGLANNNGGYIFFGVVNQTFSVEGLSDENFAKTDPAEINRTLASSLDPIPRISKTAIELGGKSIGIIHVEKHAHAPIMALKNIGNDLKEGTIYYRYVGETRAIKPGELRQIIADREQKAVAEFSTRMRRVATGVDATLNLDTGEVNGKSGTFVIDKSLLSNIQFIREGDFSETKGAPALRLIGDVEPVKAVERHRAQVIRDNVTADAVIRNFLEGERVADPMQYIHFQAHAQRRWLPIWYYIRAAGCSVDEIVDDLRRQVATHPASRDAVVQRLLRKSTAQKEHLGKPSKIMAAILDGSVVPPTDEIADVLFANAVQGLPSNYRKAAALRPHLLASLNRAQGNNGKSSNRRSAIYRAACRLDELLYSHRSS